MAESPEVLANQIRVGIFQFAITLYNTLSEQMPKEQARETVVEFLRELADNIEANDTV